MKLSESQKFLKKNHIFILITLAILFVCCIFQREGFKSFDNCKNGSYPFDFCINIPFESDGLYKTWDELEDNMRQHYY